MKVKGYARVSGRGQVEGDGFPRQFEAIEKFCTDHGLVLGRVFREEAVSGTVEGLDRPAFTELLMTVESGDVIVVERMDRLARDLMVSELLLAECRKRNIKVFSADQGQLIDMASDGGDPTRVLIRQLMGALAQWQKSELVLKLRKARERKREKFGRCEGFAPYGEKDHERMVLKIIRDMRIDCSTWNGIAQFLNQSGFTTRWNKPWTDSSVKQLYKRTK